jgi:plastocyanin
MSAYLPVTRSTIATVFLSLAALLLLACSVNTRPVLAAEKGRAQAASSPAASQARVHFISISGFKFLPATLTVKTGETVEWKNEDTVVHTATADDKTFDSGNIAPGKSWTFVASKPGTYTYICTIHPNMKGTLTVQ